MALESTGTMSDSQPDALPPRRLFLVSDVHVDAPENQRWIDQLSETAYQRDALILAGDVSEELALIKVTLRILASKFARVYFTPGNHDLWAEGNVDSMAKLHAIINLCDELGVATRELWACSS